MVKTKKGWDESKKNLTDYLNIGDEVDEKMWYYFLEVLPPIRSSRVIQISEPYDYNDKEMFTYITLKKNDERWYYIGTLSTKDAKNYTF